jgi:diadenosine tetraphosphate (Ap4A) HIT family hydrolase
MHTIFETDHWAVSHRKDSRYPGFLIVASKSDVVEISGLSQDALSELGHVLAKTESILISHFKPYRVITAKLGFSKLKKTVS